MGVKDDQYGLVKRMAHRRMTRNARFREDIEYDGGVDDEFLQPWGDDW